MYGLSSCGPAGLAGVAWQPGAGGAPGEEPEHYMWINLYCYFGICKRYLEGGGSRGAPVSAHEIDWGAEDHDAAGHLDHQERHGIEHPHHPL